MKYFLRTLNVLFLLYFLLPYIGCKEKCKRASFERLDKLPYEKLDGLSYAVNCIECLTPAMIDSFIVDVLQKDSFGIYKDFAFYKRTNEVNRQNMYDNAWAYFKYANPDALYYSYNIRVTDAFATVTTYRSSLRCYRREYSNLEDTTINISTWESAKLIRNRLTRKRTTTKRNYQ